MEIQVNTVDIDPALTVKDVAVQLPCYGAKLKLLVQFVFEQIFDRLPVVIIYIFIGSLI